uniref:Putative secreted protein n=1 Tax=Anopheles triannulatus TaxID=58253 RepID=A0A2M4B3U3_9DIPT
MLGSKWGMLSDMPSVRTRVSHFLIFLLFQLPTSGSTSVAKNLDAPVRWIQSFKLSAISPSTIQRSGIVRLPAFYLFAHYQ